MPNNKVKDLISLEIDRLMSINAKLKTELIDSIESGAFESAKQIVNELEANNSERHNWKNEL